MAAHTAVGYLLAVGFAGAAARRAARSPALLGLALWVVCLNGGTLALNSAFDRDEGDIAYLRRPAAAAPPSRRGSASALMALGQILAFGLPGARIRSLTPSASSCRSPIRCRRSASRRSPAPTGSSTCGASAPSRRIAGWAATGLPHRCRARPRAAGLLPALRGALPAHPALPARGGHPARRPHARLRARRPPEPDVALAAAAAGVRALRRGRRSRRMALRRAGRLAGGAGSLVALGCLGRGAAALAATLVAPGAGRSPAGHVSRARRLGGHRPRRGARPGAR